MEQLLDNGPFVAAMMLAVVSTSLIPFFKGAASLKLDTDTADLIVKTLLSHLVTRETILPPILHGRH
eukprot:9190365-Pyramimonas_sp.AAC.1